MLERLPPGATRDGLQDAGARLADALNVVRAVCVSGQRLAPSEGDDLPGGYGGSLLDAHRALARSATLAAQAGEIVTLAIVALRRGQPEEASRLADAVTRAVEQVADHVGRAQELVRTAEQG
jgi:hypothetical protein